MIVDENTSWYLQHNIDTYTSDPKGTNKLEVDVSDGKGIFNIFGAGFTGVNFRLSINGYMFANGPLMTMKKGKRVRWYVVVLCARSGNDPCFHQSELRHGFHHLILGGQLGLIKLMDC